MWETTVATGDYRIESWQEEAASEDTRIACGRSQKARLTLTESAQTVEDDPHSQKGNFQLTVLELKPVDFVLAPVEHEQWRIIGQ